MLGVAAAWVVERTGVPGRRVWALLLVAPLAVPPFVTSYAWATLGASLQGSWARRGSSAFSYYPIVFLLVAASLRVMDPALEETARSLGLGAWRTFVRVVLPQLRPALLGGMLLVVLDTLVEFDAFVGAASSRPSRATSTPSTSSASAPRARPRCRSSRSRSA